MKTPNSSRLLAGASIAGGAVLALLALLQGWSGMSTLFLTAVGLQRECNSTAQLPHVYTLNPKYGSEFEGKSAGFWNESGGEKRCQHRIRQLLERDELRLRPTIREPEVNLTGGKALPIFGNVFPDGLYFVAVGVGEPAKTYYLDIDTGSDLTWITCDAPCVSCAKGPHAWYNPRGAQLVDCQESLCGTVQTGHIQGCALDQDSRQCDYDVHYGDGSSSQGVLVRDELAFLHPEGKLVPTRVAFGCAYDQEGALVHSPSRTDGILGLGSAPVSLPSQLAAQGVVSNMVGHCLTRGGAGGGYLFLGNQLVPAGMTWTPMLGKPAAEYYYVRLQGIKYGAKALAIDPAVFSRESGGAIFDSGSSFTYLVEPAFKPFLAALVSGLAKSGLRLDSSDPSFPHCWRGALAFKAVADAEHLFSPVELHFGGGSWFWNDIVLRLEPENYLLVNARGNICLAMLDSGEVSPGGATTIIGDIALRGYLVVYDNVHHQVGWIPKDCSVSP